MSCSTSGGMSESQAVDDSVGTVNDLADRFVAKLRHDTSRTRVVLKPLHRGDDPFDDKAY